MHRITNIEKKICAYMRTKEMIKRWMTTSRREVISNVDVASCHCIAQVEQRINRKQNEWYIHRFNHVFWFQVIFLVRQYYLLLSFHQLPLWLPLVESEQRESLLLVAELKYYSYLMSSKLQLPFDTLQTRRKHEREWNYRTASTYHCFRPTIK